MRISTIAFLATVPFLMCSCAHDQNNYSSIPPTPSVAKAQKKVSTLQRYEEKDEADIALLSFTATNAVEAPAIADLKSNNIVESNTLVLLQTNLAADALQISNVVSDDRTKTVSLTNAMATIKHDDIAIKADSKIISGIVLMISLMVTGYSVYMLRGIVSTGLVGIIILAAATTAIFAATSALTLTILHLFGAPFPAIFGR